MHMRYIGAQSFFSYKPALIIKIAELNSN